MTQSLIATPPHREADLSIRCEHAAGRHGSYSLTAEFDQKYVYSQSYQWNVWLGHAHGQLLMDGFLNAAETKLAALKKTWEQEKIDLDSTLVDICSALDEAGQTPGLSERSRQAIAIAEIVLRNGWGSPVNSNGIEQTASNLCTMFAIMEAPENQGKVQSLFTANSHPSIKKPSIPAF